MEKMIVKGFRCGTTSAGIKKAGKVDMALIVADGPVVVAGTFTRNRVVAAPVTLTKERIAGGTVQAVLINSGNANACTGRAGYAASVETTAKAAFELGIAADHVAVASTGVIGVQLPVGKMVDAIPALASSLREDGWEEVARAIMTTDAFPKISSATGTVGGKPYSVVGIAKGAGMIHPNMGTMLAFIVTDAAVDRSLLQEITGIGVEKSFNRITVDGDTSTNDTVLVMASGSSGIEQIRRGTEAARFLQEQLEAIFLDLAKMMAKDGEGATKLVEIQVTGAPSKAEATQVARSIATSSLVKTAFFGQDANWGRIIAAAGYSGVDIDQDLVAIWFNDVEVVANGLGTGPVNEAEATKVLQLPEFCVRIDLGLGDASDRYYTSDLTYDYVRINADYRS